MRHLCLACEEVYLFCQSHNGGDLPAWDPGVAPAVNRAMALAELAWHSGPTCPGCGQGELQAETRFRLSETLAVVGQEVCLVCTDCDFVFHGTVYLTKVGPSALTPQRLKGWQRQVAELCCDARVAPHLFESLLGKQLATEFYRVLQLVEARLMVYILEE